MQTQRFKSKIDSIRSNSSGLLIQDTCCYFSYYEVLILQSNHSYFKTLNEEQILKILSSAKRPVRSTNIPSDIFLTDEQRINNASSILNQWANINKKRN
ncbi:hypothetical protein KLEB273_gp120 [Bacillus phage vB_BauM_KLEB27-3]|nr:hypothetical protein KLEB273_gp120 [Bacillus phage vB_BauM_KLEB27-3]